MLLTANMARRQRQNTAESDVSQWRLGSKLMVGAKGRTAIKTTTL